MHSYSSEDKRQNKDPALMEFHSSAGRCIIKKGINKQFKYLWKCYEGHKIGYWIESTEGGETTFVWMVNGRALWEVNIRDKTYMRKSQPSENQIWSVLGRRTAKERPQSRNEVDVFKEQQGSYWLVFLVEVSKGKGESSRRRGWWGGQKANDLGSKGLGKECSIH